MISVGFPRNVINVKSKTNFPFASGVEGHTD